MGEGYPATVTEREALASLDRKRAAIVRAAKERRGLPPGARVRYDPQRKEFIDETAHRPSLAAG